MKQSNDRWNIGCMHDVLETKIVLRIHFFAESLPLKIIATTQESATKPILKTTLLETPKLLPH